jgi:hypothetical protein
MSDEPDEDQLIADLKEFDECDHDWRLMKEEENFLSELGWGERCRKCGGVQVHLDDEDLGRHIVNVLQKGRVVEDD